MSIERELGAALGAGAVLPGDARGYSSDETEGRGVHGVPEAVVLPGSTEEVARAVAWCYEHDVAIVPRGGGSGFAGGAVPVDGGVVLGLERMAQVRSFEPLLWRMAVEAGVRTSEVRRRARENGLLFPPDPGAAEQSQVGGNIATNAGGPHAFKYGVTGHWVTGIEAVVPPGEVIGVGGPIRKDVSGYDLRGLLVGSEGTLGIVTAAWLRLLPAPEARLPVATFHRDAARGCDAIERVLGSGLVPAALEYLDGGTLAAARAALPGGVPEGTGFMVLAEADGSVEEAARLQGELAEATGEGALDVRAPDTPREVDELWRWRDGVSIAVTARRGGKVSEDIVVPIDRLREAIAETVAIGERHGLEACSWGHAGDGNLHSTFLVSRDDNAALERAESASADLFELALRLGGSVSGEHGIGSVKRAGLVRQQSEREAAIHAEIKRAFDPKGLLNPGKKSAGSRAGGPSATR
ncbi:MAG TPA: FAD-linked oxidase C-terminal domain-containing protein [Solirubrobacterales bacterium]|jgi:glycolate oxidase subunit GlcD|nr:FAD-linked oxidase C-terminal domain-containing protein [Solirubrobacterales bacterium]